jgi:hypothetical protein
LSFNIVSSPACADGILLEYNGYDNQIYAYGPGLSATTVSAPTVAVPQGSPVLIQGTVTDQSPGQTCLGIPAAGTPAISDASQSAWMEYMYQQPPKPTTATGVPIHLTAIDPNGNFQDVGTATSNALGNYAISWVPPVPGLYTVTARFEGTNSYYSSQAGTSFIVSPAAASATVVTPSPASTQSIAPTSAPTSASTSVVPSPSVAPQPTSGIPTTTYIAIAAVVVIIAVIAVALVLRRRT